MGTKKEYDRYKAAQKARDDHKQSKGMRIYWHNPSDKIALLVLGTNIVLAFATLGLYLATRNLVEDAKNAGRAWVVPHLLRLEKPLKPGEDASLLLFYGNSGREPANKVGTHNESASIGIETVIGPPETAPIRLREAIEKMNLPDSCEIADKQRLGGVVYPGSLDGNSNAVTVDQKWITQNVVNGLGFVIIKGCVVYETINLPHKSRYCFFYNSKIAELRPAEHRNYLQS